MHQLLESLSCSWDHVEPSKAGSGTRLSQRMLDCFLIARAPCLIIAKHSEKVSGELRQKFQRPRASNPDLAADVFILGNIIWQGHKCY